MQAFINMLSSTGETLVQPVEFEVREVSPREVEKYSRAVVGQCGAEWLRDVQRAAMQDEAPSEMCKRPGTTSPLPFSSVSLVASSTGTLSTTFQNDYYVHKLVLSNACADLVGITSMSNGETNLFAGLANTGTITGSVAAAGNQQGGWIFNGCKGKAGTTMSIGLTNLTAAVVVVIGHLEVVRLAS